MHYFNNMSPKLSKEYGGLSKGLIYIQLFTLAIWASSPLAKNINEQQNSDKKTLTLSSAIKRTLEDNPRLKVFDFRQVELSGEQQTQALRPAYERKSVV